MAPTDILGLDDMTRVTSTLKLTKASGKSETLIFEGPLAKAEVFALNQILDPLVDEVTLDRPGGDKGVVTLEFFGTDSIGDGAVSDLEETWDVLTQDLWKNIRAHQSFNQVGDQEALERVREAFERGERLDVTVLLEPGLRYYKLLLRGVEEYARTAVILQSTKKVAVGTILAPEWEAVDTAVKLFGEPGSPEPDVATVGTISDMPEADDDLRQWLKRAPNVGHASDTQYNIVQQWWFARTWSNRLYGGDPLPDNP